MEQRQVARKGPDVRSATIAKAAPQVIVGCGYLTDVIISLFRWHVVPFKSGEGESGLLPDRTQGAGLSRRLAGEVYGLT